ncbi:unnamed protein product [Caenorhabditis angaria]|uniref:Uncharacterized protein n=1 Tax=Caenorhabditis angaria TaxID=860376 RepID=A0A9P1N005_9PELO|nr:unnamed protein product [Caenorhabditis angaria]
MVESNENDNTASSMNNQNSTKTAIPMEKEVDVLQNPQAAVENVKNLAATDKTENVTTGNVTGTRSKRRSMSVRRSNHGNIAQDTLKATVLTFQALKDNPSVARLQLLLCNISERDIFAKLKCSGTSNVTAFPSSSGHISPKSQLRLVLTWKRPENVENWKEAGLPKILLTTYFTQHGILEQDEAPTNIRLVARVSAAKECSADEPPIEQLLLDAVGKDDNIVP